MVKEEPAFRPLPRRILLETAKLARRAGFSSEAARSGERLVTIQPYRGGSHDNIRETRCSWRGVQDCRTN